MFTKSCGWILQINVKSSRRFFQIFVTLESSIQAKELVYMVKLKRLFIRVHYFFSLGIKTLSLKAQFLWRPNFSESIDLDLQS